MPVAGHFAEISDISSSKNDIALLTSTGIIFLIGFLLGAFIIFFGVQDFSSANVNFLGSFGDNIPISSISSGVNAGGNLPSNSSSFLDFPVFLLFSLMYALINASASSILSESKP